MKPLAAEQIPVGTSFQEGALLLVNKPKGWTSFDVVNKIRYALKNKLQLKNIKVGHAGTLDPMATGLLLICTGKATKNLSDFQNLSKIYTGTIMLGATTPSYDAETAVNQEFPIAHITTDMIEAVRQKFLGSIEQIPPMFSAIKMGGQPLYKKARRGETIEIQPRPVNIYSLDITRLALPELDFRVHCTKGTYIRSLAYDLGQTLQSGAYLTALCRTHIGSYSLDQAWSLDALLAAIPAED